MKSHEDCHAVFITITTIADAGIALDEEPPIRKRAHVVETLKISLYLRPHSPGQVAVAGLENSPARRARNGTCLLYTSPSPRDS